jgi:hypothetical protein
MTASTSPRTNKLLRRLAIAGGALAAATAFIGFLHTPAGRPLMATLFGASCPVLGATADDVDNGRRMGVKRERAGKETAPARPALGFVLETTNRDQVDEWAKKNDVDCDRERPFLTRCKNVDSRVFSSAEGTGKIEELTFGFRADGRLVNVATLRRGLTPADGNRIEGILSRSLYKELGKPEADLQNKKEVVSAETLTQSKTSVRYSDYFADIVAINLPTSGVAVREQYLSALD